MNEINYDLTIKTTKDMFRFIVELKDLKTVLQQVNFKEIESVELHRHKAKRKSL
jgi:hypothetical protein